MWLVGCVLAAMVGFNLLRSLVLAWVSRQPRSSSSTTGLSSGSSRSTGNGGSSYSPQQQQPQRSQQKPQQGVTVDVELETAGSGLAAAEERANAERAASGAAAGPGPGSSSSGGSAAAAAASFSPGVEGGNGEVQPLVQMASYQLRERGRQGTSNLGRVVICAVLAPPPAAPAASAGAGAGAGASTVGPGTGRDDAAGTHAASTNTQPAAAAAAEAAAGGAAAAAAAAPAAAAAGSAPWRNPDWHSLYWKPLFAKYGGGGAGPDGGGAGAGSGASDGERVTGLLVHYGDCVLHVLEGDNNLLFALLRELRPSDAAVHGLVEIRVPCYILDLQERLFDSWDAAAVPPPPPSSARRRLTRADLAGAIPTRLGQDGTGGGFGGARGVVLGLGAGTAALGPSLLQGPGPGSGPGSLFAGGGGGFLGAEEEEEGLELDPDAVAAAEQESAAKRLVGRIQQLELFIKFVGPKVAALADQAARAQALSGLAEFETTTPPRSVVAALATDEMAPALPDFIDAYDADYRRYLSLLAAVEQRREQAAAAAAAAGGGGGGKEAAAAVLAGLGGLLSDIRHLGRYYDDHVNRDLQEALAARAEARRQSGSGEVVRRLARGMRLKVQ
ncbi:hypothetical protein HXX76_008696 [Chlamydomonas incerta]|uniref:Uncharacterized protein n=1 Tax=Chlamydomonas incerta TaxID=51695 RepID=A0A835STR8_CHLIN|nr:hypothetical protein HXX76_008696 [Chlamydomonas incerta]|eukprot:KAG2432968.1 hypothetical protein HXX76_008696 [Chlamydomonas incerta]